MADTWTESECDAWSENEYNAWTMNKCNAWMIGECNAWTINESRHEKEKKQHSVWIGRRKTRSLIRARTTMLGSTCNTNLSRIAFGSNGQLCPATVETAWWQYALHPCLQRSEYAKRYNMKEFMGRVTYPTRIKFSSLRSSELWFTHFCMSRHGRLVHSRVRGASRPEACLKVSSSFLFGLWRPLARRRPLLCSASAVHSWWSRWESLS